jgi:hypothetical protein
MEQENKIVIKSLELESYSKLIDNSIAIAQLCINDLERFYKKAQELDGVRDFDLDIRMNWEKKLIDMKQQIGEVSLSLICINTVSIALEEEKNNLARNAQNCNGIKK